MILTLIVVVVALISISNLAMVVANEKAAQAARDSFKKESKVKGLPVVAVNILGSLLLVGLWTAYAIHEGDWRYAAITWIPFITNLIGKWAMK